MAIQRVTQHTERLPSIDEIIAETGMPRDAAALHLLILSGGAFVGDLECIPDGQRDAVQKAEEEAEAAFLAEMEHAAEVVDPSLTVEENVARTGLDRRTIEVYLSLRRVEAPNDRREAE